jgi:hypothetical protein
MTDSREILDLLESERKFDLRVNKSHDSISIYPVGVDMAHFGTCEIGNIDFSREEIAREYGIDIIGELWYFNRIKVKTGGTGLGTALMEKLVEILDSEKITLYDDLNPYGDMSFQDLVKFNKRFGFVILKPGTMIRFPK